MITFQDYEKIKGQGKIEEFIYNTIMDFKSSDSYMKMLDAKAYYEGDNTTILNRRPMIYLKDGLIEDFAKANNRVSNNFLEYIVTQEVSTLLSNGLKTEDTIKGALGNDRFDVHLMNSSLNALIDGVNWGYCYIKDNKFKVATWRGTEFIPLFDERTGELRAGIRFYQIDNDKPIYIEFYEEDGITEYKAEKDKKTNTVKPIMITEKRAYLTKLLKSKVTTEVAGAKNWSRLPIFPLYANEKRKSVFTTSFKSKNDLYDIIFSDFGNTLEDSRDIFWVLKNYQGEDINEFYRDFKEYKAIKVDDDGEATPHTVEVPYQARETALKLIEQAIYKEAMAFDTTTLTGSSLNTTAIKSASDSLNKKVDKFEWQVVDFVDNIVKFYLEFVDKDIDYQIKFIRSGLANDSEHIKNLVDLRDDLSDLTFYEQIPFIEDAQQEIDRIAAEGIDKFQLENNNIEE